MPQPAPPGKQGESLSYDDHLNIASVVAEALSVLTTPFLNRRFGKCCFGALNVTLGGVVLFLWLGMFPGHEKILWRFGALWLAVVTAQSVMSHWSHQFGVRQHTRFMGIPLIMSVLPFGLQFSRRVLNPLLTFGLGRLIEDQALSLLLQASSVGQVVMCGFIYAVKASENDALSDAMISMRNR